MANDLFDSEHGMGDSLTRREMLRQATTASLGLSMGLGGGLAAALAAVEGAIPEDKSKADYTFTAAYAASPPAVDEIAFTLEVENLMALTYGGDFMQYRPVPRATPGVLVANMAAPGNEGVIGRWVDKWEGSPDFKTWTFHIRPGEIGRA